MPKKDRSVVDRFFHRIDKRLRETRFINRIVSVYEGVGKPGEKTFRSASPFLNPFKFYKEASGKSMEQHRSGKGTKVNGVAEAVRWRIVNGPELNILLFGVPFLIDFAVAGIENKIKESKKKKKKVFATEYQGKQAVRVSVDKPLMKTKVKVSDDDKLDSAPFSDQALQTIYAALRDAGMSKEGAKKTASGEYTGMEVSEHLSEEDTQILADFLTSENIQKFDIELMN